MSFKIVVFSGYMPRSGAAKSYISTLFSTVAYQFTFPPAVQEAILFSTFPPASIACRFFDDDHSDWCEVISHCNFGAHFSNNKQCFLPFRVSSNMGKFEKIFDFKN